MAYKKVYLLIGDPHLVLQTVLRFKKTCFPNGCDDTEWVELRTKRHKRDKSGGYTLNQVIEELSTPTWDNTNKVVLLRGLERLKETREGLLKLIPQVSEPHTLIIWDTTNVLGNKGLISYYKTLRSVCESEGEVLIQAPPLEDADKNERIHFISENLRRYGKRISSTDAEVLMNFVGCNRGVLEAECAHLAILTETELITSKDIHGAVVPLAHDYPVWMFYSAFSSASYIRIMQATELLLQSKFNHGVILHLALKQARWHVLAAYMMMKGMDPSIGLRQLGKAKDEESIKERMMKTNLFYRLLPKEVKTEDENDIEEVDGKDIEEPDEIEDAAIKKTGVKRELLSSEPMIRDIVNFVKEIQLVRCPSGHENPKRWLLKRCIERYLFLHENLVEFRLVGEANEAATYNNIMKALSN